MAKASKKEVTSAAALDEFTDALGNVVQVKKKVDKNSKEAKKKAKLRAKRRARGEVVTDFVRGGVGRLWRGVINLRLANEYHERTKDDVFLLLLRCTHTHEDTHTNLSPVIRTA